MPAFSFSSANVAAGLTPSRERDGRSENKDYQTHEGERDESQSVFQGTVA